MMNKTTNNDLISVLSKIPSLPDYTGFCHPRNSQSSGAETSAEGSEPVHELLIHVTETPTTTTHGVHGTRLKAPTTTD